MAADPVVQFAWYDLAGLAGMFCVLLAFFLLQAGRLAGTSLRYQLLNLFGALGILASLLGGFNLSVFLLQLAWIGVSVYGIVQSLRGGRRAAPRRD